jgi:prepilin-type N-terminal cleavage/methylation domain-containing protein
MNRRTGFTLIELLITITIMAILMSLAVFSLRSVQANARDEERKTDIDAIAKGLEIRYVQGNPKATSVDIKQGEYPSVNEMLHAEGVSQPGYSPSQITGGYMTEFLPGTTKDTIVPPGNGTFDPVCTASCQPAETASVVNAVTTISTYIYEPVTSTGAVCLTTGCVKFNLYYRTEKDNVVNKVMSKRQ